MTDTPSSGALGAGAKTRHASWTAVLDPSFWADWAAVIGLVGLIVIFGLTAPSFFTTSNLHAVLLASAILIVIAIGQTFVIATAGIDLSMAANTMLSAVVLGLCSETGLNIGLSCLAALGAAGLVGFINGMVITKGRIPDFVVTLGSLSAVTGLGLVMSNGEPRLVSDLTLLRFASGELGFLGYPVLVAIVLAIGAHVGLFHTRFGVHLLATGGHVESARAMGIRTDRVKVAAYTISGLCAGLAAILLVARIGSAEPTVNTNLLLNAVAAVVLGGVSLFGGRGSILGPLFGALMLTTLVNGLTLLSVSAFYQPLAVGIIVVIAALIMRYQK
ncbi:ABC transporter permease [Lichenifustis flavocetrariae]|uniref:ABC transporter permease n=1 Tax=Lichenifustis flavocetrariae TaxID=2949735 RepID=A0AA41YTM3_9HYPH|nr:ABC transporter permease [Lichenifustis flavocetrariae]MCW6507001.1 ABC transporter permease [Lichenifustis flavocetrariae]